MQLTHTKRFASILYGPYISCRSATGFEALDGQVMESKRWIKVRINDSGSMDRGPESG